ncbi:MAG: hypothetical protein ACF8PN_16215 [Phycisphaerales bacterium]
MSLAKVIGFGTAAGAVGAAIWAGVTLATDTEWGILAWGIGGLVGFAVYAAADGEAEQRNGVAAAIIAVLAVLAGKYAAVSLLLDEFVEEMNATDTSFTAEWDEEDFVVYIADDIVMELEDAGEPVNWPAGMSYEEADEQDDYPADIWRDASERWAGMSESEREEYAAEIDAFMAAMFSGVSSDIKSMVFKDSFGLYDLLWGVLAVATAFKLGSGSTAE